MERMILMKKLNRQVLYTNEQITNTLKTLDYLGFIKEYRNTFIGSKDLDSIVSWNNHSPDRYNSGSMFTSFNQYISIYESNAFHCILFDGSIIRVSFRFSRNILVEQSLLYWPAPITIEDELLEEFGIRHAFDIEIQNLNSKSQNFKMRSPLRLDFDSKNGSDVHPETHLHIQNSESRLSVNRPICFNGFIKFIFLNFYPEVSCAEIRKLTEINYSGYTMNNDAILRL